MTMMVKWCKNDEQNDENDDKWWQSDGNDDSHDNGDKGMVK